MDRKKTIKWIIEEILKGGKARDEALKGFEETSFAEPIVTNYVVRVMLNNSTVDCNALVNCILEHSDPVDDLKVISEGRLKTEGTCQ